MDALDRIEWECRESAAVGLDLLKQEARAIAKIAAVVAERLRAGHKLLAFGNGGSAADAQHLAAELLGRFHDDRPALAAIALTANSSTVTAVGNDFGFDQVFARQIEGLGAPGDIALAISTSGNSSNILRALEVARTRGLFTIGFTGKTGGRMRSLVELCLRVPSDSTPRIQEAHVLTLHIVCALVEEALRTESPAARAPAVSG